MTKMGRPTKPTAIKELSGNPGRRPLPVEPEFDNRKPTCPAHLSVEAKAEWRRVVDTLHSTGVLKWTDRAVLAAYCEAYGRWVQAENLVRKSGLLLETSNGNLIQHPAVGTANKAMADMVKYAGLFGMSPSDRARISMPEPKEKPMTLAEQLFVMASDGSD